MSINPVLGMDMPTKRTFPLVEPGEVFQLNREDVDITVKLPSGTMKGRGEVFLSSRRLVFVKKGDHTTHKQFTSLEIPLHLVTNPAVERSVFVENMSVKATVTPDVDAPHPLSGPATFWVKGGCGLMLMLFRLIADCHRSDTPVPSREKTILPPEDVAYIDPEDATYMYIPQPLA